MRGVDFLEGEVTSYGPAVKLWAVVMRQEWRRRKESRC